MTGLNQLGAEWQTALQLGTQPWMRTQWYQPLDYGYDRFAALGVEARQDDYSISKDGQRIGEIHLRLPQIDLPPGMELRPTGGVRLRNVRSYASTDYAVATSVA